MKKFLKVLILECLILFSMIDVKITCFISFLWIILHEFSHILVANIFKCKFNKFNVGILGANVEIVDIEELHTNKQLILYMAGPVFNFCMAVIFGLLYLFFKNDFIKISITSNLCLGIFNMLPAYPLDGSKVCEILLSKKFLYKKSKRITETLSFIIAGALFLTFNIVLLLHKVNITLFLAAIFIMYTTFLEKEKTMYIIMSDMIKKLRSLKKHEYIENQFISVYYKKGLINLLALIDKNKFNTFYILNDNMEMIGIVYEDELIKALKTHGNISIDEYLKLRKNV